MRYTMMQVCKETGMTYQALKFYCNEGLVPNVKRDKNNRRVFDERDVAWISSLTRLKKCGMSIQEMEDYLALCLQGERTIPQRKILLAQKAFSNFDLYPLLAPCLAGTEASGLYESRLGKEELPEKENHVFCAAYRVDEFNELLDYADHIVFNSPAQLAKFGPAAKAAGKSVGLRINPERSTQEGHAIYDPCAPGSRLGTTRAQWDAALAKQPGLAALLDGLHFHTLCEQDADALAVTLDAVEEKFGDLLPGLKWLNFGGGHHITRPGYDLATLEACIARMQEKYGVQVYLEPGEAWALNAGYLVTTVLDTLQNGDTSLAILDMSAVSYTHLRAHET